MKPNTKPAPQVAIGRGVRTLPQSTATPEGVARTALMRALDRNDALKKQHAAELAERDALLAEQKRNERRDSLRIIASQAGDAAKLDAVASRKFVANVLNEDARWNPPADVHGTRPAFPVREVMARLLDAIAKESQGAAGVTDVRKLSPTEYADYCRKRGLHMPALGYHNPV